MLITPLKAKKCMEETKDEIEVEETQLDESSSSEETQEKTVPYDRFQEVINDKNELKETLSALKEEVETLKNKPTDEEVEPSTWKEAGDYATERAYKKIQSEIKAKQEADSKVAKQLETQVEALRGLGTKISKEDEIAILEQMVVNNKDLLTTTNEYLSGKEKKTKATQRKEEGFVPSQSKGAVETGKEHTYQEIKTKSLDDLIDEAS